jgi:hypothetical protein
MASVHLFSQFLPVGLRVCDASVPDGRQPQPQDGTLGKSKLSVYSALLSVLWCLFVRSKSWVPGILALKKEGAGYDHVLSPKRPPTCRPVCPSHTVVHRSKTSILALPLKLWQAAEGCYTTEVSRNLSPNWASI